MLVRLFAPLANATYQLASDTVLSDARRHLLAPEEEVAGLLSQGCVVPGSRVFLIAPHAGTEYRLGPDRSVSSDHRQVVVAETEADVGALIDQKCSPTGPVIVVNWFPKPVSVHCFGCGEFIEMPEGESPWFWLRRGEIADFLYYHTPHARNLISGWGYPVDLEEPAVTLDAPLTQPPPPSIFAPGTDGGPVLIGFDR